MIERLTLKMIERLTLKMIDRLTLGVDQSKLELLLLIQ